MERALRKRTVKIANSESVDSDCIIIDSPPKNFNGLFIDLTAFSSPNENPEPPKKIMKQKNDERIKSPLRPKKAPPNVLKTIDLNSSNLACSRYQSPSSSKADPKIKSKTNKNVEKNLKTSYNSPKSSASLIYSSPSSTSSAVQNNTANGIRNFSTNFSPTTAKSSASILSTVQSAASNVYSTIQNNISSAATSIQSSVNVPQAAQRLHSIQMPPQTIRPSSTASSNVIKVSTAQKPPQSSVLKFSTAQNSPQTAPRAYVVQNVPQAAPTAYGIQNAPKASTSGQSSTSDASKYGYLYCHICFKLVLAEASMKLKGCGHRFCHSCLVDVIYKTHDKLSGSVKCPYPYFPCKNMLDGNEVEILLGTDNFKVFQAQIHQNLESKDTEPKRRDSHSLIPCLLGMDLDFIPNMKPFECKICFDTIEPGNGIILYECLHEFCKECLSGLIEACEDFEVKCPWDKCGESLREREIKALVSNEVFEKHLQKSLKLAEHGNELTFHCRTPDCPVFMEIAEEVNAFRCASCKKVNCIPCKAIHEGRSCKDYQEEINPKIKTDRLNNEIQQSEDAIKQLIEKNQAMYCPKCSIPVMKVDGCDFIKCTACKLGICWVTKKPRQTLKKADGTIIEGCKCREPPEMKRCHPKCGHCH